VIAGSATATGNPWQRPHRSRRHELVPTPQTTAMATSVARIHPCRGHVLRRRRVRVRPRTAPQRHQGHQMGGHRPGCQRGVERAALRPSQPGRGFCRSPRLLSPFGCSAAVGLVGSTVTVDAPAIHRMGHRVRPALELPTLAIRRTAGAPCHSVRRANCSGVHDQVIEAGVACQRPVTSPPGSRRTSASNGLCRACLAGLVLVAARRPGVRAHAAR